MSFTINTNTLTTSSGVLTLEEASKSIVLKSNQRILTDKFATGGTYVFTRGINIPIAYFAARKTSGSNSTFVFNTSTGTVGSIASGSAEVRLPEYFEELASLISDQSVTPTYYISGCVSSLSPTASVGTTEKTYFLNNKKFNQSAYSLTNKAPTVRCNDEQVPNTNNGYINGTMNGTNVQIGVSGTNYSFITLSVRL